MQNLESISGRKIKLVIFDCDGVLLDSEKIGNLVEIEALKTLNINISNEDYQKRFAGVTTKNTFASLAKEAGITLPKDFLKGVEEKVVCLLEQAVQVIPHVYETLQKIKEPKAVASNSHFDRLSKLLTSRKLTHFFDGYIFSADMVAHPKPAPDLYQYVAQKMLAPPEECLVIEDSATGVQAAKHAGMNVLGFIHSQHCLPEDKIKLLNAGAQQVFFDMRELPCAIDSLNQQNCQPLNTLRVGQ